MSEHGAQFDRAQRAYDAQTPGDDWPDGPDCDECGAEMEWTSYKRTPRWLGWSAKCKCGNKRSYDSAED